jgi:ribosomal protein L30E
MRDENKTVMIQVILNYLYSDEYSRIIIVGESCAEFMRGLIRYNISWIDGEIDVFVFKGKKWELQRFKSSRWFKVGSYLRSNFASVKIHLKLDI